MNYDMNNTTGGIDEFHTPLKRLPDRSIYEFEDKDPHFKREKQPSTTTDSKPEQLIPLNQISMKLSKTKLFTKQNDLFNRTTPKKSIYYRPPASANIDNQFGIKEFLPPRVQKKYSMAPKTSKSITSGGTEEEEEEINDIPTGEWVNPVMKRALSRQINREYEVKSILTHTIGILVLKLIDRILSIKINVSMYVNLIVYMVIIRIIMSGLKLLKGKDQCIDLPLNNRQRQLLGLNPLEEVLVSSRNPRPRYAKIT